MAYVKKIGDATDVPATVKKGKLSAAARRKLPRSSFAGPKINGKPSFPMPDKAHARAALRLLPSAINAGHVSAAEAAKIRARAHRMLGTKPKGAKKDAPAVHTVKPLTAAQTARVAKSDALLAELFTKARKDDDETMGKGKKKKGRKEDWDDESVVEDAAKGKKGKARAGKKALSSAQASMAMNSKPQKPRKVAVAQAKAPKAKAGNTGGSALNPISNADKLPGRLASAGRLNNLGDRGQGQVPNALQGRRGTSKGGGSSGGGRYRI